MVHKRDNQLYIKRLQQVSGLWERQEWPHNLHHSCAAVFHIQDTALMLGVDGACMGLDKACSTNRLLNPLRNMFERDWSRRGGKRSYYDVNLLSSRTCNTHFVDCLVQDAYGNVAIKIEMLTSPQHMYIN